MKLKLVLLMIVALGATNSFGQSPAKILKSAEKAHGGAKTLQRISSVTARGRIMRVSDGATGSIVFQTARPNLYNISFDLNGFEIESGYNGKSGWMRDSRNGLRTLTGDASVDFQSEAAFRSSLWLDAKREKTRIVAGTRSDINGKQANAVVLNTAKGPTVKLSFDPATNLVLKEEFSAADGTRTFLYSDYRAVEGIQRAHRVTMEIDGEKYDVVFDEVKHNAHIAKTEFDFPNLSGAPLPDIPGLLAAVQANEDKVENLLDTYSYMQRVTRRELGKDGVLRDKESDTFQMSFYKGYRLRRLTERNGKALSAGDQEKEDKEIGERVEEIEKRIAKREATGGPPSDESRRVSIAEVLRASKLTNPRRERFRGRDVIVFDFEPNPAFDYKNAKSMLQFFGKTAGAIWIDEKDRQVARVDAFLIDSFKIGGGLLAKLKRGASFTLEQERVNDEIWLPSVADLNMSIRVFLVKGLDLNQVIRSYDYRKFATEVKDARVNDVNNQ